MKIVEYRVEYHSELELEEFAEKINSFIKEGWQPFGAPFTVDEFIHQALVRYDHSN